MIDQKEFNNLLVVGGFKLSPSERDILILLNKGPMRLKNLRIILSKYTIAAIRKALRKLENKDIIVRSYNKNSINAFFVLRRTWVFTEYQKYLNKLGASARANQFRCINKLLEYTPATFEEREKRRIERRLKDANVEEKKRILPDRDNQQQKIYYKEGREIGDTFSKRLIEDGTRFEFGQLILSKINTIVDDLKRGASASSALLNIWRDVWKDADSNSNEVERGLIADYKITVEGHPENERDTRIYLWLSDLFHILDMYEASLDQYNNAIVLAKKNNLDIYSLLAYSQISKGHILLHLNRLPEAIDDFQQTINEEFRGTSINPILRARSFFRLGEVHVYRGDTTDAIMCFNKALDLCKNHENENKKSVMIERIKSDAFRKIGTAYRMDNKLDECFKYYQCAEKICRDNGFRGYVWLLHGWAEYYRAKAYEAMTTNHKNKLKNNLIQENVEIALKKCEEAKMESARIRNINRYAHALLIECEIDRLQYVSQNYDQSIIDKMIERYEQALGIYLNINSRWGEANVYISQYLAFYKTDVFENQDINDLLDNAEFISEEMRFEREIALIRKIRNEGPLIIELNPLSLF